jgi:hypothetical protein
VSTPLGLWRPAVTLPLRLSRGHLRDSRLNDQLDRVQSNRVELTVTRGSLYILSGIVGRSIVEPVRWAVLDGVLHMLSGALRTDYPQRQDLLAPTYGETIGVLLRALLLGGDLEILYLLDGSSGKTPDFLLVQSTNAGPVLHLVECKGTSIELHSTNRNLHLDVCQKARNLRNSGKGQLENIAWNTLQAGGRLKLKWHHSPLSSYAATCAVAVVVVPDARVLKGIRPQVAAPARRACQEVGVRCVDCLGSALPDLQANLVVILDEDILSIPRTIGGGDLDPTIRRFVDAYRRGQRGLWAEDEDEVTESVRRLAAIVEPDPRIETDEATRSTLALALAGYADAALSDDLLNDPVLHAKTADLTRGFRVDTPEDADPVAFEHRIAEVDARLIEAGDNSLIEPDLRESAPEMSATDSPSTRKRESRRFAEEVPPSARRETDRPRARKQLLRFDDAAVREVLSRKLSRPGERILAPWLAQGVAGVRLVVDEFGGEQRVRVTAPDVGTQSHAVLQSVVEQIVRIADVEQGPAFQWRNEFAELRQDGEVLGRLELGRSWEPSPLPNGERPGITAWVGRDGRAEVVIRRA